MGTAYVTVNRDFGATGTASTMVQAGNAITITLGTPSGAVGTQAVANNMIWTPSATATDRAGNTCQTTNATEADAARHRLLGSDYQFVAVEVSISPTDASQRSASMAALQPSPAAVTAWR